MVSPLVAFTHECSGRIIWEGVSTKGSISKYLLTAAARRLKSAYAFIMRPLERDGGRRLEDFSGSLWFARRNVRYDALANNIARMVP